MRIHTWVLSIAACLLSTGLILNSADVYAKEGSVGRGARSHGDADRNFDNDMQKHVEKSKNQQPRDQQKADLKIRAN